MAALGVTAAQTLGNAQDYAVHALAIYVNAQFQFAAPADVILALRSAQ